MICVPTGELAWLTITGIVSSLDHLRVYGRFAVLVGFKYGHALWVAQSRGTRPLCQWRGGARERGLGHCQHSLGVYDDFAIWSLSRDKDNSKGKG